MTKTVPSWRLLILKYSWHFVQFTLSASRLDIVWIKVPADLVDQILFESMSSSLYWGSVSLHGKSSTRPLYSYLAKLCGKPLRPNSISDEKNMMESVTSLPSCLHFLFPSSTAKASCKVFFLQLPNSLSERKENNSSNARWLSGQSKGFFSNSLL